MEQNANSRKRPLAADAHADSPTREQLTLQLREGQEQIRTLKDSGAFKAEIDEAYERLKPLRQQLSAAWSAKTSKKSGEDAPFDRNKLKLLLQRQFFYVQSSSIYKGGVAGLVDFGPMGAALQNNLRETWRRFFVQEQNMLELDAAMLTPTSVLSASRHVDDVKERALRCTHTSVLLSADRILRDYCVERLNDSVKPPDEQMKMLLEVTLRSLPKLGADSIHAQLEQWNVLRTDLYEPVEISGLVEAQIGPNRSTDTAYLRPEGIQSAMINFKRLFEYNQKQLPFAVAQAGTMFHNDVPFPQCEGFMNTREFCVFEVCHFDAPNSTCAKLKAHMGHQLTLYTCVQQDGGQEALRRPLREYLGGVVKNETVLFYMARCATFLKITGIKVDRLRFRQLLTTEIPHYAQDAWDAEVLTSYGFTKVASVADRGTYDAEQHSRGSGERIVADVEQGSVTPSIVQLSLVVPRLMYTIVEHAFRDEGHRLFLELQGSVAPYHCILMPTKGDGPQKTAESLQKRLIGKGIRCRVDTSTELLDARKTKADETGTLYSVVVDSESTSNKQTRLVKLRNNRLDQNVRIELNKCEDVFPGLISDEAEKVWSELSAFKSLSAEAPEEQGRDDKSVATALGDD